ncbi:HAD family hydrolase [Mycoplasma todarodis]|uniref:HAD family hydrolase n=1 Tax=Mycoplasma todarodis TaxID=1937191 RepID=UPI003B3537A0
MTKENNKTTIDNGVGSKLQNLKYAFFDLDGTLLNKKKNITNLNLESLEILRNQGIKVGIATGRPQMMIKNIINLVKPDLPIISINGGLIKNNNESINDRSFDVENTQKIYNWLIEEKIDFLAYTKDEMFYNDVTNTKWVAQIKERLTTINDEEKWIFTKEPLPTSTRVSKFLILTENVDESSKKKIQEFFNAINESYLVESLPIVLDVMPKGISKGEAISTLDQLNYIELEKTIVFGDAPNDITMFNVAGVSVAVPNSHKELEKIADINLKDTTDDYIYNFINEFIKNKTK